jgi:hypothetical protein
VVAVEGQRERVEQLSRQHVGLDRVTVAEAHGVTVESGFAGAMRKGAQSRCRGADAAATTYCVRLFHAG